MLEALVEPGRDRAVSREGGKAAEDCRSPNAGARLGRPSQKRVLKGVKFYVRWIEGVFKAAVDRVGKLTVKKGAR